MAELDTQSYQQHIEATIGDAVVAEDNNGNTYSGTVWKKAGATIYVQSNTGEVLEFRRFKNKQKQVIVLAIDGKEITEEKTIEGVNKHNIEMTKESITMSFDAQITEFKAEQTEHKLG